MTPVWVALTFLAVAALAGGLGMALAGRGKGEMVRRLDAVSLPETGARADEAIQLMRDESLSAVPLFHRFLERWGWSATLRRFIAQAGWKIRPGKLVLLSGVLGLGGYLLASLVHVHWLLALLWGAAAGLAPLGATLWRRRIRLRTIERMFPDAIDLLVRAVRAGHGLTTGMEMIAGEVPEPLGGEFRIAFDEHNFGLPLRDALWHLAERVPLDDMRFFVSALLIQKETGGNLAEILQNLSRVIRQRFQLKGEVRARTAQGRLTAGVLIVLPLALIIFLRVSNPDYIGVLFTDPTGVRLLIGAACAQVIGSFVLWRIVNLQV